MVATFLRRVLTEALAQASLRMHRSLSFEPPRQQHESHEHKAGLGISSTRTAYQLRMAHKPRPRKSTEDSNRERSPVAEVGLPISVQPPMCGRLGRNGVRPGDSPRSKGGSPGGRGLLHHTHVRQTAMMSHWCALDTESQAAAASARPAASTHAESHGTSSSQSLSNLSPAMLPLQPQKPVNPEDCETPFDSGSLERRAVESWCRPPLLKAELTQ